MDGPQLDLSFQYHPRHGTWLDRRRFRWPYTIARGFREGAALRLIVQTVSGAIQADDLLAQRIELGAGARACVMTQGATPVYRAPAGLTAREQVELVVADGGHLDWRPEPRILFPDARLSQRVALRLPPDASAFVWDGFVQHDPCGAGRPFHRYESLLTVSRPDGALLAADRLDLAGPPLAAGPRARYAAHGLLVLACAWLDAEEAADAATRALADCPGVYAAAAPLPNGAGVAARVAAVDGQRLRAGLALAHDVLARSLREPAHLPTEGGHPHVHAAALSEPDRAVGQTEIGRDHAARRDRGDAGAHRAA